MKKYQNLIDNIPESKIKEIIAKMVKQYDLTGDYCDGIELLFDYEAERYLKSNIIFTSEFIELLNQEAEEEFETAIKEWAAKKSNLLYYFNEEPSLESIKRCIYKSLFDFFISEAKRLSENREQLRLEIGSSVNYEECDIRSSFGDVIEFYKDGGWGIGDEDGVVIVKNHLKEQPSKINNLFGVSYINSPYRIIQDRDTKKYGILSLESYEETLHCLYDKIEIIEFDKESYRHFFIKVMKNGKWGCFDEKCVLIIDIKYDEICLTGEFLECTRDGELLISDTLDSPGYESICAGKKDLYNAYGELLIGGFDHVAIDNDYLLFYWGTFYESYNEYVDNFWNSFQLSQLCLNYSNSLCLVLDKEFRTIIQNEEGFYRIPKGSVVNSLEDLKRLVPEDLLFKYRVDLEHWGDGFVFLHNSNGEQYLIPNYIERGFDSPEEMTTKLQEEKMEMENRISEMRRLMGIGKNRNTGNSSDADNVSFDIPDFFEEGHDDCYVDDDIIIILKFSKEKKLVWCNYINEDYIGIIYRKGRKIGFINENGLSIEKYDAITVNSFDSNTYVASVSHSCISGSKLPPNSNKCFNITIQFYRLGHNGELTQMDDDWNSFNPTKCRWFPAAFLEKNGLVEYDSIGYYGGSSGLSYEKYGGYNGYDDDTIDYGFDGFPEATWNVD